MHLVEYAESFGADVVPEASINILCTAISRPSQGVPIKTTIQVGPVGTSV